MQASNVEKFGLDKPYPSSQKLYFDILSFSNSKIIYSNFYLTSQNFVLSLSMRAFFYLLILIFVKYPLCSVAALGFQIKGFQMRDVNTNACKVEKLQNVSHFSYFLDRFILEAACFITIAKQSIQNPWVQEPFIEVPRVCQNPC